MSDAPLPGLWQSIQLRALANAILDPKDNPDVEAHFLRNVFRWYSKEFHTPLHTVIELPLVDIMLHYYESQYENMEEPQLEAERVRLTETEKDREARERAEKEDSEEVAALIEEIAQQERDRIAKREGKVGIGAVKGPGPALSESVNRPKEPRPLKEAVLNEAESIPVLKMVFEVQEAFDLDISGDSLKPGKP